MKKYSKRQRMQIKEEQIKHEKRMEETMDKYDSVIKSVKSKEKYVCFHNVQINGMRISTINQETKKCDICGWKCNKDSEPVFIENGIAEKVNKSELLNFSKDNLEKYIILESRNVYGVLNNTEKSVKQKISGNYEKLEVKYTEAKDLPPLIIYDVIIPDFSMKRLTPFSELLKKMIEEKKLESTEVYKRANIDAKLFSKILNNTSYHPGKSTVLALAVAMKLSITETEDFIAEAGYAFSPNILSDIIVKYCIEAKYYDIDNINSILFEYNQKILGSKVRK